MYREWIKTTNTMISWDIIKNYPLEKSLNNPNVIILESTRYKDKNGNDIFEGDIIYSKIHNPSHFAIEIIEGEIYATHPDLKDYPTSIEHFYPSIGCLIEVVGNIYETPELLK